VTARGLKRKFDDFEDDEGELDNLILRAEKLHFLDGVLWMAGPGSG